METGQVTIMAPTVRTYKANRIVVQDERYTGPIDNLAIWYYMNINADAQNLIIFIHGNWHQTIPNPPHITVEYDNNGVRSQKFHMSVYPNGHFFQQLLPRHRPIRSGRKSKKFKKHHKKPRVTKKLSKKRNHMKSKGTK